MRHRLTTKPSGRKAQVRIFQCESCGVKVPATKVKGRTHTGHVKDFYCFQCQAITKHIQIDSK